MDEKRFRFDPEKATRHIRRALDEMGIYKNPEERATMIKESDLDTIKTIHPILPTNEESLAILNGEIQRRLEAYDAIIAHRDTIEIALREIIARGQNVMQRDDAAKALAAIEATYVR